MSFKNLVVLCAVAAGTFVGCGHSAGTPDVHVAEAGHHHDSWWCDEHGVPEDLCSLCSAEVASKLKKEGDWCKLHDLAQS